MNNCYFEKTKFLMYETIIAHKIKKFILQTKHTTTEAQFAALNYVHSKQNLL